MQPAHIFRRLMAALYDTFLVLALLVLMSFPVVMTMGESLQSGMNQMFYQAYIFLIIYAYFMGFWLKSGQTLGQKVWRIILLDENQRKLSFLQANMHFFSSLFSWLVLGFVLGLFRKDRKTLQDLLSLAVTYHKRKEDDSTDRPQ